MASKLPNSLGKDALDALLALGTVKAMLVTSDAFDKDAWTRRSHITNEVATGGGYTAGGVTVTCTTATDNGNDRASMTFADATWATATFTARGCIYVLVLGGASSADPILAFSDFGENKVGTGADFIARVTTPAYLTNPS
jgi:hypothetical protein